MMRILRSITAIWAGILLLGGSMAHATVLEWDTVSLTSSSGTTSGLTFTSTSGTATLKARAYSTNGTTGLGYLLARKLGIYSGGLGVNNCSTDDCSSPDHSLDNNGKDDLIVFEFPAANFSMKDLSIGWSYNDSDIQVWVGGPTTAGLNLLTACGGSACTVSQFASLGFSSASVLPDVPLNTPTALPNLTGRYLIVAAQIGTDEDDYAKISQIRVNQPVISTTEPLTIAIFGMGLLGMGLVRRRHEL